MNDGSEGEDEDTFYDALQDPVEFDSQPTHSKTEVISKKQLELMWGRLKSRFYISNKQ